MKGGSLLHRRRAEIKHGFENWSRQLCAKGRGTDEVGPVEGGEGEDSRPR